MNIEELKKMLDFNVETAKKILSEENEMLGMTFLVVPGKQLSEKVTSGNFFIDSMDGQKPTEEDLKAMSQDGMYSIITVVNEMSWQDVQGLVCGDEPSQSRNTQRD